MNINLYQVRLILIFSIVFLNPAYSQLRLPRLISDGMVLQRDSQVKIWGWSDRNEHISLQFIDSVYHTTSNDKGEWSIILKRLKAGGPFNMKIIANNVITINDILIGDVWVCSGQSNMELPIRRVSSIYQTEIASSENTFIRQFYVPQQYNFKEAQKDLATGSWKSVNPKNILDFSAVAYFFAKELFARYKVPVGILNACVGGSPAEAWISEESLKKFPTYYQEAQKFKDSSLIQQIEKSDRVRIESWYKRLREKDEGYKYLHYNWFDPAINTSDWATVQIPGYWMDNKIGAINGVIWFRKEVLISNSVAAQNAKLILGRIVDADSVFINGVFIGSTPYQYPPRRYDIPAGLLKKGKNTIVVRVISNNGKGGFVPDKSYELNIGGIAINLKGDWQYRIGAIMEPLANQTFIRLKPLGLYNSMISPLVNYRIKGVIWYQGESNVERPLEYKILFPALIQDWRINWKQDDFPFLFVQLANYNEVKNQPAESDWALLRESQLKTLTLPNTGMAVTIDIGEWNDIHPLNKKDVGKRLALAAYKIAYQNKEVVSSGPIFQSMEITGKEIILSFTNTGSGLFIEGGGELKNFVISGVDKHFAWAKAKIVKDKVVVWNDEVSMPIAVRYCWADNPARANLYNKEGLPASPFRTDNW